MDKPKPTSLQPLNTIPAIIVGTVVGCVLFVGGYFYSVGGHQDYGLVIFFGVPVVSGFCIAAVARTPSVLMACTMTTLSLCLGTLIVTGLEGIICCAMALPIVAAGMLLGAVIGHYLIGSRFNDRNNPYIYTLLIIVTAPLLIAAADAIEKPFRRQERVETFSSEVTISADRATIWKKLIRMSPMNGEKPFLLRVGLPLPHKCTMDQESLGGERVCHFDQGQINQRITAWNEPSGFKVDIIKSTLPGRLWLTFRDAEYELITSESNANETKVIRRTTISSRLYPRWYWRTFEEWGVASETEFVLSSLKKSVEEK